MLVLTGCSAISAGRITDKTHTDDYYYTTYICSGYNAQGVCTINVPVINHVDDQYTFSLEQGDKTGWVNVTEATYNEYEIGDTYGKADSN